MTYKNFEEFLQYKHAEQEPQVLDDDLPDAFNDWLANFDNMDDFMKWADEYAAIKVGELRTQVLEDYEKMQQILKA